MTEAKPSRMEICRTLLLVLVFLLMTGFMVPEDNIAADREAATPITQAQTGL